MKYKVFDKEKKEFVDDREFVLNGKGVLLEIDIHTVNDQLECLSEIDSKRFVPIFSTGKFDKNGIEIYEGDILEGCRRNSITIWNDDSASYELQDRDENWQEDLSFSEKWYTVIGSVYTNPELMEATK